MLQSILYEDLTSIDALAEELGNSFYIHFDSSRDIWRGMITRGGSIHFFEIHYHQAYPIIPPFVYCFEDDTFSQIWHDIRWRKHVYIGGNLCLFTPDSGESGWKGYYRLGTVLRKFLVLIDETEKDQLSSEHVSEKYVLADYAWKGEAYINRRTYEQLQKSKPGTECYYTFLQYSWQIMLDVTPFIPIVSIFLPGEPSSVHFPQANPASCYFLPEKAYQKLKRVLIFTDRFLELCAKNNIPIEPGVNKVLFIGHVEKTNVPAFLINITWILGQPRVIYIGVNKRYSALDAIFRREIQYLKDDFDILTTKRVMVIGLGSLGSKIATELARNGIKRLVLFDNDFYKPENVARSVAPLAEVGKLKVDVMRHALHDISPQIAVDAFPTSPLHPLAKTKFVELLDNVDLVVVAIDEVADEHEIHQLCLKHRRTIISVVCLDHAHFGRVYRVIPGQTACTVCINIQSDRDPGKFPSLATPPLPEEKDASTSASPYEHPGVPGVNIDIWEIALKATRFCLQTLARGTPLANAFPDAPGDHFLISNQAGWIFDAPYQMKYLFFEKLADCPACGKNKQDVELEQKQKAEFERLQQKYYAKR